jgi:hypothetical protein
MLRIVKSEKLGGSIKTKPKFIRQKPSSGFFHLILWAFEIKIKRVKKFYIRLAFCAPY